MDIQEKTFNVVKLSDLEAYIKELYGFDPKIRTRGVDWGLDAMVAVKVDGELRKWERGVWTERSPNTGPCLNKLCEDHHIPEGTYLVEMYS